MYARKYHFLNVIIMRIPFKILFIKVVAQCSIKTRPLIRATETNTYYILKMKQLFYMLRYKRFLEILYRFLWNDNSYNELTHMKISYGEITDIYKITYATMV